MEENTGIGRIRRKGRGPATTGTRSTEHGARNTEHGKSGRDVERDGISLGGGKNSWQWAIGSRQPLLPSRRGKRQTADGKRTGVEDNGRRYLAGEDDGPWTMKALFESQGCGEEGPVVSGSSAMVTGVGEPGNDCHPERGVSPEATESKDLRPPAPAPESAAVSPLTIDN